MLYIYTDEFTLLGHLKASLKYLGGRAARGPKMVQESLTVGLTELGEDFLLNSPNTSGQKADAIVLNGPDSLRWAIKQKTLGKFRTLLAGPNLVILPTDEGGLIMNPAIDKYVVPALWTQKFWSLLEPGFSERVEVWPAGVRDSGNLFDPKGHVVVYLKSGPQELVDYVGEYLVRAGLTVKFIKYGSYTPAQYLAALSGARAMVFFSNSESQGIALLESWMGGVPTLVWSRGYYGFGGHRFDDVTTTAPYLSAEIGERFSGVTDFEEKWNAHFNHPTILDARQYAQEHFTTSKSANSLLQIFEKLHPAIPTENNTFVGLDDKKYTTTA